MTAAAMTATGFDAYQMAPRAPAMTGTVDAATAAKVGRQFESQFVSQMFQHMFEGIKTDGLFGGGSAEEMFRSLLMDEYGKMTAARGNSGGKGFGIASAVQAMLLKHQEVH